MYPKVNVSEEFLDSLDEIANEINSQSSTISINSNDKITLEKRSLQRIINLLKNAQLNTDIQDRGVIKIIKSSGNKNYSTFKEWFIHLAYKQNRITLANELNNYAKANECFFSEMLSDNTEEISLKKGLLMKGKPCTKIPFFLEHTFATIETTSDLHEIINCKHPCSGMVIIDSYLFNENSNNSSNKIDTLISILKEFISPELEKPFQLDIIIENKKCELTNSLIEKRFNQILKSFGHNKLSLHIYAPNRLNESDRYFITNYSVITVGHPLDRNSNISCNFYPSHENESGIKSGYKLWKSKIDFAINVIKGTPPKIGETICILKSDNLIHDIFITE